MGSKEDDKSIYKKLREFRRARGLTANTLAEKMGENPQKIGRIERGARNLTVDYLVKISKALETPLDVLLDATEVKEKKHETNSNILHEVIVFIEQQQAFFPKPFDAQQKAKAISKIYELTLNFPEEHQRLFLSSLSESLSFLLKV